MNDIGDDPIPYPPKWRVFPANPLLPTLPADPWSIPSTDIRELWCWDKNINGQPIQGCDEEVKNSPRQARGTTTAYEHADVHDPREQRDLRGGVVQPTDARPDRLPAVQR